MTDISYPLPYVSARPLRAGRPRHRRLGRARVALRPGARVGRRDGGRHRATGRQARGPGRGDPGRRRGTCRPVALDVTDADQITAVLDDVSATEGILQILVNNAGIPDAPRAHKMSIELIDQVLDTNVRAPVRDGHPGRRAGSSRPKPGPHREHRLRVLVQLRRRGCRPLLRHQGGGEPHDRGARGGVGAQQHQRHRDRTRARSTRR